MQVGLLCGDQIEGVGLYLRCQHPRSWVLKVKDANPGVSSIASWKGLDVQMLSFL